MKPKDATRSRSRGGTLQSLIPPLVARKPRLSEPLGRFALALAALVVVTSSFDIFLVFEAGGTFRFGQLLAPVLAAIAIIRAVSGGHAPTLGARPLFAWLLVQLVFFPVTDFWPKSLGYCFWLCLDLSLMFSFVQLFSDNRRALIILLHWYLYSFGIVAAFGIIQFLLPLAGLPAPLIADWWVPERVARVNGFSYEPSYYASYLLIGFVLTAALQHSELRGLNPKITRAIYWLCGSAIVLSSSRMGITFLLLDVISYPAKELLCLAKHPRRFLFAPIQPKKLLPFAISFCALGLASFGTISFVKGNPEIVTMLVAGTGVYGAAAHSVVARQDSFNDTLTVFEQHPWIGRSIGGVSSAIAELHGEQITSFKESKPFEGMSVFAEALAGSGLIGVVPFVIFLVATIYKPVKLAKSTSLFYSVWLRALVRALLFELAILQLNQNILRPYLWIHFAVLALVYSAAQQTVLGVRKRTDEGTPAMSPVEFIDAR